jgi:hypothetical protein
VPGDHEHVATAIVADHHLPVAAGSGEYTRVEVNLRKLNNGLSSA